MFTKNSGLSKRPVVITHASLLLEDCETNNDMTRGCSNIILFPRILLCCACKINASFYCYSHA